MFRYGLTAVDSGLELLFSGLWLIGFLLRLHVPLLVLKLKPLRLLVAAQRERPLAL